MSKYQMTVWFLFVVADVLSFIYAVGDVSDKYEKVFCIFLMLVLTAFAVWGAFDFGWLKFGW